MNDWLKIAFVLSRGVKLISISDYLIWAFGLNNLERLLMLTIFFFRLVLRVPYATSSFSKTL